jgi:hypothetical protein
MEQHQTPRARVILSAARNIQSKDAVYGDPRTNLACAGELKRVFVRYAARSARTIGPAEHEAIDMLLTKIARIATGPVIHDDNYSDAVAYAAIAGECALAGSNEARPIMPEPADEADPFDLSEQELLDDSRDIPNHESHRPALSKNNADRGSAGS